ncbi:hypothetical protein KGP36_08140 [Patescibacteria group bacterium]|nr:hypothetical protein [Patescibacteria group bacterium]
MTTITSCTHQNFHANVAVGRLAADEAGEKIVGFSADIRVSCADCGKPFEWVGLPMGYSPLQPMCSVDATEARMPLKPQGEAMNCEGLSGFSIRIVE